MECHVSLHRSLKILRLRQLLHSRAQPANLHRCGIRCGQPRILRLQHEAHLDELPQSLLVIGNQQRQRADHLEVGGGDLTMHRREVALQPPAGACVVGGSRGRLGRKPGCSRSPGRTRGQHPARRRERQGAECPLAQQVATCDPLSPHARSLPWTMPAPRVVTISKEGR